MKYETRKEGENVVLKLGSNHEVTFEKDSQVNDIVEGVESLIQTVVGISAFELALAVVKEFNS